MDCIHVPELIYLEDYGGNYNDYESAVYALYQDTFEKSQFYWDEKPIYHKKHPEMKGKPATFWHITSSGSDENSREPDLRRYETIAWPAFILEYCLYQCRDLLVWKNRRKGKTRILLWCRDIDYVVILDERKDFCIFWTAYPVNYKHTRDKFLKEYNEYQRELDSLNEPSL